MDTLPLPQEQPPWKLTPINARCWVRDVEGMRTVFVWSLPLFRYGLDDRASERNAAVTLVNEGWAQQDEVAAAFNRDVATVRRWQRRHEQWGPRGLERKRRHSPLLKMGGARDRALRRLFAKGEGATAIARQVGVTEGAIRHSLRRLGLKRQNPVVPELDLPVATEPTASTVESSEPTAIEPVPSSAAPAATEIGTGLVVTAAEPQSGEPVAAPHLERVSPQAEAKSDPEPTRELDRSAVGAEAAETSVEFSLDADPKHRVMDRMMACLGLLQDACPMFAEAQGVPGAGVLLVVPLIVQSGIVEAFQRLYGRSLEAAFYGVRTTVMMLLFMALLRIKRPENLKERGPLALGQALGLDRSAEVKTLRRRLTQMARQRRARSLMRDLACRRLRGSRTRIGFLYVDGHVREYHGHGRLAKAYVTRRRLAAKGTTDVWVNDRNGEPVFVVTCEINEKLNDMLEPVLHELEQVLGKHQRLTVVFDRGGWDHKLFARLIAGGYDILTYRKGRFEPLPEDGFVQAQGRVEGTRHSYCLHDMSVRLGQTMIEWPDGRKTPLWLRQVTRLQDGHQTPVLTSRQDLNAVTVLWRMFNRWRQENFLKYMRQEYALDAMVDYNLESVSTALDRPNPARTALQKQLAQLRGQLRTLEADLGGTVVDAGPPSRETMAGFRRTHAQLMADIAAKRAAIGQTERQRDALPKRVPADELQRLSTERKLITDCVKITAYQIESRLVDMVSADFARSLDEGRKLIVPALASPADLCVRDGTLQVTLAAQSSPHRTRALAALCEQLNAMDARYPGTTLPLRYQTAQP